jgi:hypothetical protein
MKRYSLAAPRPIQRYTPGDLLLESLRLSAGGPMLLDVPAQPSGADDAKINYLFDIAKPKPDDYPALKRTLQLMKFSPDNVNDYYQSIGEMINVVSGIVSVVGAVISVVNLVNSLLGPHEDQTQQYLQHISQRVDQIYGYLALQVKRGLHDQRENWKNLRDDVRNAVHNARTSRSPLNLAALKDLKALLDDNIHSMLDPESAKIPFLRATYNYTQ